MGKSSKRKSKLLASEMATSIYAKTADLGKDDLLYLKQTQLFQAAPQRIRVRSNQPKKPLSTQDQAYSFLVVPPGYPSKDQSLSQDVIPVTKGVRPKKSKRTSKKCNQDLQDICGDEQQMNSAHRRQLGFR